MPDDLSAATIAYSPSPAIILLTDPRLHELQTERHHSPVTEVRDGEIYLTEAFSHLHPDAQLYIVTKACAGELTQAARLAYCYTRGRVYEICVEGDFARAHPNLCHDKGCRTCATPESRLRTWLGRHDWRILSADDAQFGVELEIASDDDTPVGRWRGMQRLLSYAKKFTALLSCDTSTFTHAVIDSAGPLRARLLIHNGDHRYHKLQSLWRRIVPLGTIRTKHDLTIAKLYEWAFEGTAPLLLRDGATRAHYLTPMHSRRLSRISGQFYRPLSAKHLREMREANKKERHARGCPCCHGKVIDKIDHQGDTIEAINERYAVVDWGSHDPRLVSTVPYRNKYPRSANNTAEWAAESRYGPN